MVFLEFLIAGKKERRIDAWPGGKKGEKKVSKLVFTREGIFSYFL